MGLSLDEIAVMVNSELNPSQVKDIFILKKGELRQRVEEEQKRLEQVEKLLFQIEKEGAMPEYAVTIKKVEPQLVASVRDVMPGYASIGPVYGEIFKYLAKKMIFKPYGPVMFICHDNEYKESDVDIEAIIPINKKIPDAGRVKIYELPGLEQAASIVYNGPNTAIHEAYTALMNWIKSNGYQIEGLTGSFFYRPKTSKTLRKLTELQFPIKTV
jgi:effector-binding domain-containing protein